MAGFWFRDVKIFLVQKKRQQAMPTTLDVQ
jgi:hypothetical protein